MVSEKFGKGKIVLNEIEYDYGWIKTVMGSGHVGKVYVPKDLIGKKVRIIPVKEG